MFKLRFLLRLGCFFHSCSTTCRIFDNAFQNELLPGNQSWALLHVLPSRSPHWWQQYSSGKTDTLEIVTKCLHRQFDHEDCMRAILILYSNLDIHLALWKAPGCLNSFRKALWQQNTSCQRYRTLSSLRPPFTVCGAVEAPWNDLSPCLLEYKDTNAGISASAVEALKRHLWYPTEEMILLSLFNEIVPVQERQALARRLLELKPDQPVITPCNRYGTCFGKPRFPESVSQNTTLCWFGKVMTLGLLWTFYRLMTNFWLTM